MLLNPENGMSTQVIIDLKKDDHQRRHPEQAWGFRLPLVLILRPHVETAAQALRAPLWWRGDAATGRWERLGEIPEPSTDDWVF